MDKQTIESEEFYNLCQAYRHMPITNISGTVEAYNNLIAYIDKQAALNQEATREPVAEITELGFTYIKGRLPLGTKLYTEAMPNKDSERVALKCPCCDDDGFTVEADSNGEATQCQCEFCYTVPNSIFNLRAAIDQAMGVNDETKGAAK